MEEVVEELERDVDCAPVVAVVVEPLVSVPEPEALEKLLDLYASG